MADPKSRWMVVMPVTAILILAIGSAHDHSRYQPRLHRRAGDQRLYWPPPRAGRE